ncbi:hypothetical protein SPRG_09287 [Saprolegnia parasitica CBS 223.65]|uniref:Uncharacterized protein n=1 Tax=Saprolegnia parasitica (strain CBS 223.65) TaxID=695850 RepID=A0A067C2Z6_SAPPC|nr:hypothetical protein SPRG_09287 [Saprolegnia parasitica CBS 223.65]KDO25139.1 hypothetical protein SPRG_09287 [Saprolegnia parasitica CBS 223.65]|eukprot:XP_012204208.1 hypothetical protein SPRG_09287 [Saprolegnia parasitica CBS 223.65]
MALAKELPAWSLTVLDVSLNYIENAGIEALASALPHLPTLQRLDVSHNAGVLTFENTTTEQL